MQYLKVQYARTDVLAKNTEPYTKENKTSSNSFQSILQSLQSQSNASKVDSKNVSVPKEKETESSINSSVSKEQKKEDEKREIQPVKVKKVNEPKSVGEDSVQLENDDNQVYMIIDLSNAEIDNSEPLKDLALEEVGSEIEFVAGAQVEAQTMDPVVEAEELEELASEIALNPNGETGKSEKTDQEKTTAAAKTALQQETEVPQEVKKEPVEPKLAKVDDLKTDVKDSTSNDRKVFTVFDERTVPVQEEEKKEIANVRETKGSTDFHQNAQVSMLSENARANILSTNNQTASATGSTFQQMLSQQIQQNAPEFAKAGTIILKDQNSGSINMVLKPEILGNVKINLQLSDKNISGHIIVQSKEAMEAFKENLDLLKQSFRENGFENAQLSLSLSDSASENHFAQNKNGNDGQYVADRAYKEYGQSGEVETTSSDSSQYSSSSEYQIDVVA